VSGPAEGVVCYSHAGRRGRVLVGEHLPTSKGSKWCCCSMGDLKIEFSGEVFSRRCEEHEGEVVPQAEIGEHDGGRVCS